MSLFVRPIDTDHPAGDGAAIRLTPAIAVIIKGEPRPMRRATAALLSVLFTVSACGGQTPSQSDTETASAGSEAPVTSEPAASQGPVGGLPRTVAELARAVVYIEAIDESGEGSGGSGTLISDDGLILTNAHVAAPFDDGRTYSLSVGLTTDAGVVPEADIPAELLAADVALDLALIKVNASNVPELTYLEIGDSDAVEIGEDVHILGYPGIGGDTITYTRGQISGFTGDALLGDRAWIKTDAVIAGGNSGGLAANMAGQLIAVPTQASASTDGPIVDCRVIADTNDDDVVNEEDTCVPIGGFLNGLRPAIFAADMIAAVERGVAYEPMGGLTQPDEEQPEPETDEVLWSQAVMTSEVDESTNLATNELESLPSGASQLCAVWEYAGMSPGLDYDAVWMIDGEVDAEISYLAQTWAYEDEGSFWICTYSEDGAGIADGFYVAAILVEGEQQASGWTFVGDDYAPVQWAMLNSSSGTFCYIYVSPTVAPGWGHDRLGSEEVLPSGGRLDLAIPPGEYDILIEDCDQETLFEDTTTVSSGGILEIGP